MNHLFFFQKYKRLIELDKDFSKRDFQNTLGLTLEEINNKKRALLNLTLEKLTKIDESNTTKLIVTFSLDKRSKNSENDFKTGSYVFILDNPSLKNKFYEDRASFKGFILSKNEKNITIEINLKDKKAKIPRKNVVLILGSLDITYDRQLQALEDFQKGFTKNEFLKEILLEDDISSKVNFQKQNTFLENYFLNIDKSKRKAVSNLAFKSKLGLIHGPPGTGKTQTSVEIILQEISKGSKILVSCDSNEAVDNILEKFDINEKFAANFVRIGQNSKINDKLKEYSLYEKINFHPLNQFMHKIIFKELKLLKEEIELRRKKYHFMIRKFGSKSDNTDEKYNHYKKAQRNQMFFYDLITRLKSFVKEEILNNAKVVFSTNNMAYIPELRKKSFDLTVIDEATQATLPSLLIPLNLAKRAILAGDHKQLPPTVLIPENKRYKKSSKELSKSLFEDLIEKDYPKENLEIQYRMNEDLLEFPNKEFYGFIQTFDKVKSIKNNFIDEKNIIFIDTKSNESVSNTGSKYNMEEVNVVVKITKMAKSLEIEDKILLITPYNSQKKKINEKIKDLSIQAKTIDASQGQENDIVILSLVRANDKGNLGFLKDLRRINVALTRAKKKLIVIGNKKTINKDPFYSRWLDFVKEKGKIITPEEIKFKKKEDFIDLNYESIDKRYDEKLIEDLLRKKDFNKSTKIKQLSVFLQDLFGSGYNLYEKTSFDRVKILYEHSNTLESLKKKIISLYWISLQRFAYMEIEEDTFFYKNVISDIEFLKFHISKEDVFFKDNPNFNFFTKFKATEILKFIKSIESLYENSKKNIELNAKANSALLAIDRRRNVEIDYLGFINDIKQDVS